MSIHIHPTAANPADIRRIQARTGLVAVFSGSRADLVSTHEFANRTHKKPQKPAAFYSLPNGNGPSAA